MCDSGKDGSLFQNLVTWYTFGTSSGNLISDSSGNNRALTNLNSVQFDSTDFRQGSGAASFSGSNYFEVSNDGTFSPANFTVACWARIVQKAGYMALASTRVLNPVRGWIIYIKDNAVQFWTSTGVGEVFSGWDANNDNMYANFATATPTWRHLAITMQQSTSEAKLYIDGLLIGTYARTYARNTETNLRIGAAQNEASPTFLLSSGSKLDDFVLYSKVFAASEVSTLVGGLCLPCSPGTYSIASGSMSATACTLVSTWIWLHL